MASRRKPLCPLYTGSASSKISDSRTPPGQMMARLPISIVRLMFARDTLEKPPRQPTNRKRIVGSYSTGLTVWMTMSSSCSSHAYTETGMQPCGKQHSSTLASVHATYSGALTISTLSMLCCTAAWHAPSRNQWASDRCQRAQRAQVRAFSCARRRARTVFMV
jgi:hypothetical protein